MGVNWGSVPDWLAGSGALLALMFARRAVRAANATNKQQSHQIAQIERAAEDDRQDRRRQQASQIAVWLILKSDHVHADKWTLEVRYSNSSGQPVYDVLIYPRFFLGDPSKTLRLTVLPPTTGPVTGTAATKTLTQDLRELAEESYGEAVGYDGEMQLPEAFRSLLAVVLGDAQERGINVTFNDQAGVTWVRDFRGRLDERTEQPSD